MWWLGDCIILFYVVVTSGYCTILFSFAVASGGSNFSPHPSPPTRASGSREHNFTLVTVTVASSCCDGLVATSTVVTVSNASGHSDVQ